MTIRNKVIISVLNNREVLFSQGYDPVRDFHFFCPVGGGVEFGESISQAAERELSEELGLKNQILEFVDFHESIFKFNGTEHHEVMFHFTCPISNETRLNLPSCGTETSGEKFIIAWHSKEKLKEMKPNIVPPGIYEELQNVL